MHRIFHGNDIEHRDIVRQIFVQSEFQIEVPFFFDVDMKEELACMNLRVGSSATNDGQIGLENLTEIGFDNFLDVCASCLRQLLPAAIVETIIPDVKEIAQES